MLRAIVTGLGTAILFLSVPIGVSIGKDADASTKPVPEVAGSNIESDRTQSQREFILETLVDFPDDALISPVPIALQHVDAMMQRLKELGVRRVSWGYYGDGHGGMRCPVDYLEGGQGNWKNYDATYRGLGNPLKVAVEAGHRHGLEVYAYFKPYETGPSLLFPEGSLPAKSMGLLTHLGGQLGWLDPFVVAHPELRIKRRTDDLPVNADMKAIRTIRLVKKDDSPTRITKEHLQIWTSENNWQYQPKQVEFQFADTVEKAPRDVHDHAGNALTAAERPVRVLTLSGLNLSDKYVLLTTDFVEGKADFTNSGLVLMTALDSDGHEIPGVFASGPSVWCSNLQDFRTMGLTFDYGWGAAPVELDAPNASGRQGLIAFTRGRNAYLPGALCETEPKVQEFWQSCLDEMLEAGVDGVDFREENHSSHTDYPEDYGFNDVILKQCGDLKGQALFDKIAEVRGNAYSEFLRKSHDRLTAAGKKMRYNLQVDWLRPNRPKYRALAYPAHVDWQWQKWIDTGLMDEAILRFYVFRPTDIAADPFTRDMLETCKKRNLRVTYNRYISFADGELLNEVRQVRQDGRFSGFILYETYDFLQFGPDGTCTIAGARPKLIDALRKLPSNL